MTYIGPVLIYLTVQSYLYITLDRSDLPGAAGSWSLYKGYIREPKGDVAAYIYSVIPHSHFLEMASLISIICGCLCILGTYLFTRALSDKRSALYASTFMAFWPPLHMLGGLYGNDPISIGLSTLGLGLLYFGFRFPKAFTLGMLGATLLPISVAAKTLGLPLFIYLGLCVCFKVRPILWLLYGYCFYWAYAWFWPSQPSLPQTDHSLLQGLEALYDLSRYRLNEGKYLQLCLAVVLGLFIYRPKRQYLPLLLITFIGIACTLTVLIEKTRPRYLIVFGLPLFSLFAQGLSRIRHHRFMFLTIISLLFIDSWAHQYALDQARHKHMRTALSNMPTPPSAWVQQYTPFPSRILRDISFIASKPMVEEFKAGNYIATPPLRDARERSLMAYAHIYGGKYLSLEPSKCCKTINTSCIKRLLTQLDRAGFDLFLPLLDKHQPRINQSTHGWWHQIFDYNEGLLIGSESWYYRRAQNSGGHTPCQRPVDITPKQKR